MMRSLEKPRYLVIFGTSIISVIEKSLVFVSTKTREIRNIKSRTFYIGISHFIGYCVQLQFSFVHKTKYGHSKRVKYIFKASWEYAWKYSKIRCHLQRAKCIHIYFIRMCLWFQRALFSIKKFWSAKVNVAFICEIKLLKRTHTIQFIRLPVCGGFHIYDKRHLVTLFMPQKDLFNILWNISE